MCDINIRPYDVDSKVTGRGSQIRRLACIGSSTSLSEPHSDNNDDEQTLRPA